LNVIIIIGAKTIAWWINQYPSIKDLSFLWKWIAGWTIAAVIEYLPLIAAFTIAADNGLSLSLMTGKNHLASFILYY